MPRWATIRRPERRTFGARLALVAQTIGQPFMPWQRMVADVGGEMVDSRPCYREILVSVPRQNGKTTLMLAWELDRALGWGRRQRIVYSAQTGNDARKKILEDQVPLIVETPFGVAIDDVRRVNGSEGIVFRGGSRLDVLASSKASGHGRTLDLAVIDEAFDDVDDRREQAILPAMVTKRDAQLLIVSTMGTDESVYLNRKVDQGREMSFRDDSRIAYFEWSAPDDADIDDPATWYACMPALGHTIDEADIRHARQTMTEGEFRRAYLNQRTASDERVIPEVIWRAACSAEVIPENGVVFAVDANPERSWASIVAADRDGRVELLEHRPGTAWVIARASELVRRWSAAVAVDPAGPAGSLISDLKAADVRVIEVAGQELTKACGQFYDGITNRSVVVRSDVRLDNAVAAAKRRPSGDAWIWARKTSLVDISPLVAATVAVYAAKNGPTVEVNIAWA